MIKRVFMVSPRYLPIIGGAEVQCDRLCHELKESFSEKIIISKLITRRMTKSLARNELINDVKVIRFGFPGIGMLNEYIFCFQLFIYLLFNLKKFDVLHCHATGVFGLTCSLFSFFFKKKVLLKISTNGELNSLSKSKVKFKLARLLLRDVTLVALNQQGYNESVKLFPLANNIIIPNGIKKINGNIYKNKAETIRREIVSKYGISVKIGVFVGRFVVRKGIKVIDNLAIDDYLNNENIVIMLIGDDSHQRDSYELLNHNERIIEKGLQKDVYPFLLASDFFLSPSYYEGLPNTVLEALSINKYCLLSNIEPHVELYKDNKNMITLFESEDILKNIISELNLEKINYCDINIKYCINNIASMYVKQYLL